MATGDARPRVRATFSVGDLARPEAGAATGWGRLVGLIEWAALGGAIVTGFVASSAALALMHVTGGVIAGEYGFDALITFALLVIVTVVTTFASRYLSFFVGQQVFSGIRFLLAERVIASGLAVVERLTPARILSVVRPESPEAHHTWTMAA